MTDRTINLNEAADIVRYECGEWTGLAETIIRRLKEMPPVDAIPVVRCADCIRYRPEGNVWGRCTVAANPMRKKDFCSYGVIDDMRKDGKHDSN